MEFQANIDLVRGKTTWAMLKELIEQAKIPENATMSVYILKGDRPFDSDQTRIQFRWTT